MCTAKASRISRETMKSGCAREWGGWGRLSEDGSGQHNPDRSESRWGRAADSARTEVLNKRINPDTEQGMIDGPAPWIIDQVEERFGTLATYLIDFSHLSDYLAAAAEVVAGKNQDAWRKEKQDK